MITSLIKTQQFPEALKLIDSLKKELKQELIFEHAYVLHRLGNNKEALKILKQVSGTDKD
jgi:hypothetical protein